MDDIVVIGSDAERALLVRRVLESFRLIFKSAQQHSRWVESQCGASSPQIWALSELSVHPGWRVSELANAMSLHQSTTSNLLEKLERKKLIRRERDAEDQRAQCIYVTEKGLALLQKAPKPAMSLLPDALNHLPEDVLRTLDVSIQEVVSHLGVTDRDAAREPINRI